MGTMHSVFGARLSNGLRVVSVQRPWLHQTVVAAFVHVGSRHERPSNNGLSHFVEHMMFRGTKQRPTAAAFNHRIESLGGTLTAATHGDYTSYVLTTPPAAFVDGCVELGAMLTCPAFSDCDVEKGIVREEILEDLDEDGRDVNAENMLRASVFAGHPLAMPLTGTLTTLERFGERHLREHLATYYVARNMSVVVVGPSNHQTMQRAASKAFARLNVGEAQRPEPFKLRQTRARVRARGYASAQSSLRVGFATPGQRSPLATPLELLLRVLDDGMSTRLHRRICDERGLAYEVHAGLELFEDVGIFDVAAAVAHATVPTLVGEVLEILAALAIEGPTREEVDKARRRYAFDLDAMEDDPHALAVWYGAAELFDRRRTPAALRRALFDVTALDVRRAARQVFNASRMNLSLVGDLNVTHRASLCSLMRRFRARLHAAPRAVYAAPARAMSSARRGMTSPHSATRLNG